jgi:uncharacterized membrane protein YedE/YeeE
MNTCNTKQTNIIFAVAALIAGLLFGLGLILAGMTQPTKVTGFLDLAGAWDPSLALVMVSAIGVGLVGFSRAKKHPQTCLKQPIDLPKQTVINRRLIIGSSLFGMGWGIAGYCPGPALLSLVTGGLPALVFFIAMMAGMALFSWFDAKK